MLKLLFSIAVWFTASLGLAGTFTASLSSTSIEEGESIRLSLSISGKYDEEPQIPEIPSVEIAGTGRSSSVSIINGDVSKETTFNYELIPSKEGTYNIPSIELEVDGEKLQTLPLVFKMGKSVTGHQAENAGSDIFIKRSYSNSEPYVGEPFIETTEIYHKVNLEQANAAGNDAPDFRYFPLEDQTTSRKEVNGEVYSVISVKKVMVASSSGIKTVTPYKLKVVVVEASRQRTRDPFSGFFGMGFGKRTQKTISSDNATINVKPLPAGAPKDFSGIVGEFQLDARLSLEKLKVGETSTLTLKLEGIGLLDSLVEVPLQFENIKIYPDKPNLQQDANAINGIQSVKEFKFALVPTTAGEHSLGTISIPVFNPNTEKYKILSVSLPNLQVSPSADAQNIVVSGGGTSTSESVKKKVQALNVDIIDIHKNADLVESHALTVKYILLLSVILLVVTLAFIILLFLKSRMRSEISMVKQKSSKAFKNYKVKLKEIEKDAGQGQFDSTLEKINNMYKTYLSEKLNFNGNSMTAKEITQILTDKNVDTEVIEHSKEVISHFEFASYSGKKPDQQFVQSSIAKINELVQKVEKIC